MVNREAMNCEQVWLEISNYVDGEVDAGLRSAMDSHFATCERCRSVLEGTRNVVALYGDERMMEVPAGFSRRLEKRIVQNARAGSGWSTWSAWLVPLAAGILIAGSLGLARSETVDRPVQSKMALPGNHIPPEMVVIISTGSRVFHVAGCPFIHNKNEERNLTAKEAADQGYVPCSRCMRKYLDVAQAGVGGVEAVTEAEVVAEDREIAGQ